jgi:outer membrane protein assembly factor BamB
MFGYSSSPLLYQGRLYVLALHNRRQDRYGTGPAGQTDSYLLALDPATGKDLWKRVRPTDAVDEAQEAYSTAVPCEHGGRPAVLVLGADALTAHHPASGEEVWRWEGYNPTRISHWRIVPSPVVAGGVAFVPGPKHSCGFAVRLGGQGTLGSDAVAWTFPKLTPDASTPLAYRGRLYVLDDDTKVLTCLDPTAGTVAWQGRLGTEAVLRASLTGADGKLYVISERHEALVLAADRFEVLHRVKMGERGLSRSTIVAAQGRLFLRAAEKLFCIGR